MKINDHLYLVGGGDYGFNLSGRLIEQLHN